MKEINLEEIIKQTHVKCGGGNLQHGFEEGTWNNYFIKESIKEGIKQALQLASEEVELTEFAKEFLQEGINEAINKESITNLINRIK